MFCSGSSIARKHMLKTGTTYQSVHAKRRAEQAQQGFDGTRALFHASDVYARKEKPCSKIFVSGVCTRQGEGRRGDCMRTKFSFMHEPPQSLAANSCMHTNKEKAEGENACTFMLFHARNHEKTCSERAHALTRQLWHVKSQSKRKAERLHATFGCTS